MLITKTPIDEQWRKSIDARDAAALVAVFRAEMPGGTYKIVALVAEPEQLRATCARRPFLQVSGPRMVGTPAVYVAVVAGGLVAMRSSQFISLEDAAAACVACVGDLREPVTYVAIAGDFVRVRVRIERGYDRENRKVLESAVYTPELLLSAAVGLTRAFPFGGSGGSVRLSAFAVDRVAAARKAHCPEHIAAVIARVFSLVDWEHARVFLFSGALLLEAYEVNAWYAQKAVTRVSAAQIAFQTGELRGVATVSAATLETYEESGAVVDEWLGLLARDLATQKSRGGDGVESSYWGFADPGAARAPK